MPSKRRRSILKLFLSSIILSKILFVNNSYAGYSKKNKVKINMIKSIFFDKNIVKGINLKKVNQKVSINLNLFKILDDLVPDKMIDEVDKNKLLLKSLKDRISADFKNNNVSQVDGWMFTQTEIKISYILAHKY